VGIKHLVSIWWNKRERQGVCFTPLILDAESVLGYLKGREMLGNSASQAAKGIMREVEERGFAAVAEYSRKFDGVEMTRESVAVDEKELREAETSLTDEEKEAMLEMKGRIAKFAKVQKAALQEIVQTDADGTTRLVFKPVERAGIYVPAGRAPLFSSLFMAALPAKEAGVRDIMVCTPPQKDGKANRYVLVAASMCGIDRVLKIGGAQAIASMAFGLEGLQQPADVICGPGNAYVNAAKMEAAGRGIRIDVPAGPSEVLVIADGAADAAFVASDMLAQSEHGADSAAICICTDARTASAVAEQLQLQLSALPAGNPAFKSIPKWGRIWIATSVEEAIEAANQIACEHLELMAEGTGELVPLVQNAGAIFARTAETFCDYGMSGGNHILPTGKAARAWGGVSLQAFGKWVYIDEIGAKAQGKLAKKTALLARMEGLEAHARAAEARQEKRQA